MSNCRKTIIFLTFLVSLLLLALSASVIADEEADRLELQQQQQLRLKTTNVMPPETADPAVAAKAAAQAKWEAEQREGQSSIPADIRIAPSGSANTLLSIPRTVFLAEDFEAGVVPPAGWSSMVTNAGYTWKSSTSSYSGFNGADVEYDPALVPQDEWLLSPVLDFTTATTDLRIDFWWLMSYYWGVDPYDNYDLELMISTDGGATFPTRLWWENDQGTFSSWTWYNTVVSLSAYTGMSNVVLAWRYTGVDGAQAAIDFINVTDDAPPAAEPGDNCAEPISVSLPAAMPYTDNNYTCGRLDDYSGTCLSSYDGGEDIVYELTVTAPVTVDITLDPLGTIWTGILLDDACPPDPSTCIASDNSGSSSTPYGLNGVSLAAGTYYVMIDTWPSPDCIPDFVLTIDGAAPAALGDDCTNPIKVDIPTLPYTDLNQTTCGRGDNYDVTCLNSYDGGEDIIYEVTVLSEVTVDITLDPQGTTYTGIVISDACPPSSGTCIAQSTNSGGSAHGMTSVVLTPGTYYLMVDTWPSPNCIPSFDLTISEGGPPPEPPANDDWANAEEVGDVVDLPFSTALATFDGPGDCQTCPNVWYCYTATCTGNVEVALCGSSYDTKLAVYDGCGEPVSVNQIGCNDDDCSLQSAVTFSAVQGNTYLIEIGGYESSFSGCKIGEGVLTISCSAPCVVECPAGAIDEGEACGTDTNGGCNSAPPVFTSIACGETVCGTAWTDGSSRDTDWYLLTLTEFTTVTWTVQAEFDALIGPVGSNNPGSGDCADATGSIDPAAFPLECEIGSVTVTLGPGDHFFFVAPAGFDGYTCAAGPWNYWASVTCVPAEAAYCDASGGCDEYISNVAVGSINNASGCDNYADYTGISTEMTAGTSYPMTVTNGNPYSSDECGVWIDWNQDHDFSDPGEEMLMTGSPGNGPYTADIVPPLDAASGNTTMRIRITYAQTPAPCGADTYGEVEDYTITVAGGVAPEVMLLDPDPVYAVAAYTIDPYYGTVYVGGDFAPGYDVNDVVQSSILINGAITPSAVAVIPSHPDFVGEVLEISIDMNPFVLGYGILFDTTTQSYSCEVTMTDSSPYTVWDNFTFIGHRSGDINVDGATNILDLTFLVDRIFRGGPAPQVNETADINADGTPANILDLTFLVDYFFRGGNYPMHP